jgi:hypothetical protein
MPSLLPGRRGALWAAEPMSWRHVWSFSSLLAHHCTPDPAGCCRMCSSLYCPLTSCRLRRVPLSYLRPLPGYHYHASTRS